MVGDDGLWHVELLWPVREAFGEATLAQALACVLMGAMRLTGEIGAGAFAVTAAG